MSCKRTFFFFFFLICLGCSAQFAPNELAQRIERQLRVTYGVPATVQVIVSPLRPSEFPNYDEVTVTFDGESKKQDYQFLVSKDKKTLVRLTRIDMSKDPFDEVIKKIDVKGRPVRGNPNAKVVMVNYDDFECPYCSRVHQTLFPQLLKEYGDRVAFIYKDYPLSEIHPWAIHAAVDANCIASQNNDAYWEFADYIHNNQQVVNSEKELKAQFAALDRIALNEGDKFKLEKDKLQSCVKDQKQEAVLASQKEGEVLGVTGTPTMFVNGQMLDGARSLPEIRSLFDSALQRAGVAPPAHAPQAAASAPAAGSPTTNSAPH
jgi:protein-disulfide isomerase